MIHNPPLELDTILKRICVRYFYLIIAVSSIFAVYYLDERIEPLNSIVGLCPIIHLLLLFIPYKLSYSSTRKLIPTYLIYISLFLCANALYFWSFGQITAFMWYIIIPVASTIFFKRGVVIKWCIYVFVHICLIFIITPLIPENYFTRPTNAQLTIINILTIIIGLLFILFFIYYLYIVKEVQSKNLSVLPEEKEGDKEENKFEKLYGEILNYFSEKKPYCDPDFTITHLAKDLNSNVKYIAKAIKLKEDINFSVFLNIYRINMIKELIAKDYTNKYTIRYIYTSAGFRHQSTFNKVFKEIEGNTPSEYIKENKGNNKQ